MKPGIKKAVILSGFILLKFVLQFTLINPEYELHRDEYLHLDLGHHLAWGYQSVPPFTSWISWLIDLLGNTVFWVKFFPALFGALTILVVWKTIQELNGTLFALILGATGVLFSALLRLNLLYQPNSFDILCWTSFYFVVIKYFKSQKPKWLFMAAVVFALAFLNKYNIVFLLFGLVPGILLTRQRKIFLQKELIPAIFLGMLLILPNLLWQYNNDFPVFHHLKELSETQLVHVDRMDFLKSQLLFFFGALFAILAGLYSLVFYKPFKEYRAFFWTFFFSLAIFMVFKAKDYYAIGLYPVYIAFGSVYLGHFFSFGWKRYLRPVAILVPVLLFLPVYNVAFPNKSPHYIIEHSEKYRKLGLLKWEDGKDHALPQDFADMLGWKELAGKVDSLYESLPNSRQTLILTDNYGQAGAINFYSKNDLQADSFNADYINWFDLDKNYVNVIRVKEYQEKENEISAIGPYFDSAWLADSLENPFAREYGTKIFVFAAAKIDISKWLEQKIQKDKAERP